MDEIAFGNIERSVANLLAQRFGRWVSTAALIDAAYGLDASGGPLDAENAIKAHVHHVRRKRRPTASSSRATR
jgi:DNA-binding response OmpR family regulator